MMRSLIGFLFVAFCLLLLLPYTYSKRTYSVPIVGATPADPLAKGRSIDQGFVVPKGTASSCLGIYFATYARKNSNQISVTLQDGSNAASWTLASEDLDDNKYRYFCPGWQMLGGDRVRFSLLGMNGTDANSPTVWLTSNGSGGEASLNGRPAGKGVGFALANEVRVSVVSLFRAAHGAFLVGLCATLLMGLAGVFAALPRALRRR